MITPPVNCPVAHTDKWRHSAFGTIECGQSWHKWRSLWQSPYRIWHPSYTIRDIRAPTPSTMSFCEICL